MPDRLLHIAVQLYDARWHGAGEWPPSPARLFQALVAGVGRQGSLLTEHKAALEWLEALAPPVIAAPATFEGRGFTNFVPNNDLDAVGGDPGRIGEIRAGKTIRPHLFETEPVFVYVWRFQAGDAADQHARAITTVVERLYQFGRGVDMACALAETLEKADADARLAAHPGSVWRPGGEDAAGGVRLRCPQPGTLQSLIDRYQDQRKRMVGGLLRQPRQPRFHIVGYNCPPDRLLFDLKPRDQQRRFHSWPLTQTAELTTVVRDRAAHRLAQAKPKVIGTIERALIGSKDAREADKALRVRIIPLPSVGTPNTEPSIRRVLVERPANCPIRADDLSWAFSGLHLGVDYETGEVVRDADPILAPADDQAMLRHYGMKAETSSRIWRTITPAALPVYHPRGRTGGIARYATEGDAANAVKQALRHAGVLFPVETIRVQREPFHGKAARAEAFAEGSRFPEGRLWHVEITFSRWVSGPLVIGDGRYCGLGIMVPVKGNHRDALILLIQDDHRPRVALAATVVRALRRALMSRAEDAAGHVPTLFSGHELGPGPAQSGQHRHVYLFADDSDDDGLIDRLGVIAPWRVDCSWTPKNEDRVFFETVVSDLCVLRAGAAGILALAPAFSPDADDPLFAYSRGWASRTAYRPTRHTRRNRDCAFAVTEDLSRECLRRGLPRPEVEVNRIDIGPRGGMFAKARLQFNVAVPGPIMLGLDAHRGGGIFAVGR